jgi:hypothetical protein
MPHYPITAGTTIALRFQLLEASSPINLTGCTVTLLLSDRNGEEVEDPGTVSIIEEEEGTVQLLPTDENVFVIGDSPYSARWVITDGAARVSHVPTGPRDIWEITGA